MGITVWLALVCLLMFTVAIFAYMRKRMMISTVIIAVMFMGSAVLGYLWLTSPM